MSHSFYIQDVANASLSQTLAALPFENLVVTEEQDAADGWPTVAHIYQDNVSVRAIETAMENGTLQIRIMANSSPDDFELAAAIAEQVASTFDKPIEPEDNDTMSLEQWRESYGPEWQKEQCRTYLQMLVGMYKKQEHQGVLRMWGTRREFHVGPRLMEPLLEDPQNFSRAFFDRFRRLNYLDREDVFLPSLMAAQHEESGKQAVFSVLGEDVPTALSSEAAFVVLNHTGLGAEGDDGQTILTFTDFVDLANDTLTWLGDGIALTPAYQGEEWQKLVAAAGARASGLFDHPELLQEPQDAATDSGTEDTVLGMRAEHWEIVANAPIAVFLLTAAADGTVDKKEIDAFKKQVVQGVTSGGDNQILAVAFLKAASGMDERIAQLVELGGEDMARIVAAAQHVVSACVGDVEARRFSEALYTLAEAVAKASGGGLFGFGSKIGKEERAVLDGIRQLLKLD